MAAEIGNKLAETVTKDVAMELANKALEAISDDCYFLSDVADKVGTYRTKFNYILEKFADDADVFDTIKRLYNKCEALVVKKTAKGEIIPSLGIFILKAYHDLMEVSKVHQEHSGNVALPQPQVNVYNTAPPLANNENEIDG